MTKKFIARTIPFLEMLNIAKRPLSTKEIGVIFSMQAGSKLRRLKEIMLVSREENSEKIYGWKINKVGIKKLMWLRDREKKRLQENKDSS